MHEVAAALTQAHRRQRALLRRDLDILGARHQRHQERFVILPEGYGSAVRRHLEVAGQIAGGVDPPRLAGQVGADQLQLVVFGLDGHEQPIGAGAELRIGRSALDKLGLPPLAGTE
jgi:hypothetical protein